jgi:hypothetical protein
MSANKMNLPWRVAWEQCIVDAKGKAVAFNTGRQRAQFIVDAVNMLVETKK